MNIRGFKTRMRYILLASSQYLMRLDVGILMHGPPWVASSKWVENIWDLDSELKIKGRGGEVTRRPNKQIYIC